MISRRRLLTCRARTAIARLEEEKASLKDYVLKYEAELSKHEAQVAQLTADLQQARPPNITTSQTRHNTCACSDR